MELPDTISLPPKPSQQRSAGIRPTNRTAFLLPTANIRADIFYAQPISPFPLSKIPAFIKKKAKLSFLNDSSSPEFRDKLKYDQRF